MRVASVPLWEYADLVVQTKTWGSRRPRFSNWQEGEMLVVLVGREGVLVASVQRSAFISNQTIWSGDPYSYRIGVRIISKVAQAAGRAMNEDIRRILTAGFGRTYGFQVISQHQLPVQVGNAVQEALQRGSD